MRTPRDTSHGRSPTTCAVLERLKAWDELDAQAAKERAWMARHTLRGLIKAGHPGAMAHLGYAPDVPVTLQRVRMTPDDLAIGAAATVEIELVVARDAPLIVDYIIDFVKSNGKTAPKASKLKGLQAKAGVPITLTKKHTFKGDATTFKLYPGAHHLHVQVNGRIIGGCPFPLRTP